MLTFRSTQCARSAPHLLEPAGHLVRLLLPAVTAAAAATTSAAAAAAQEALQRHSADGARRAAPSAAAARAAGWAGRKIAGVRGAGGAAGTLLVPGPIL